MMSDGEISESIEETLAARRAEKEVCGINVRIKKRDRKSRFAAAPKENSPPNANPYVITSVNPYENVPVPTISSPPPYRSKKRPRSKESHANPNIGSTVFLCSLPKYLSKNKPLLALIKDTQPKSVRVQAPRGGDINGGRAWIEFESSSKAQSSLRPLSLLGLRARMHTPTYTFGNFRKKGRTAYDARVRTVCAGGGCANTLLIRGAPAQLTVREFTQLANNTGAKGSLRVRTALLQGRRAFWLVYATRTAASQAFDKLHNMEWSLRCGLRFTVRPVLHDDSEDAEARKRRRRTLALGGQRSVGDMLRSAGVVRRRARPAAAALEELLKKEPENCLFLQLASKTA